MADHGEPEEKQGSAADAKAGEDAGEKADKGVKGEVRENAPFR